MHNIPRIQQVVAGTALLSLLLLPACSTATRLGQLIPKHPNSELVKGEVTAAGYLQIIAIKKREAVKPKENEPKLGPDGQPIPGGPASAGAAAAFAAELVIDAAKQELEREAEKYERQFSARTLLTVREMGEEGYLYLVRSTDRPKVRMTQAARHPSSVSEIIHALHAATTSHDHKLSIEKEQEAVKELSSLIPGNKVPQMVLAIRLTREQGIGASIYRAHQPKLWVAGVGAKVVGFNQIQPWTWLGALLLKTGNEAVVEVQMTAKALQLEGVSEPKRTYKGSWVQVEPSSTIVSGAKVDLTKPGTVYAAGPKAGSWLPIPSIITEQGEQGYVDLTFTVVEKDPSNVKQRLKKVSEEVEKNKGSWIDWVKKQAGGA